METYRLGYILITFGYVIIFGILSATILLLHLPKERGLECYKKARRTLGFALITLALYSLIRLIIPQHHHDYEDFWLLVTFTLIHSWLTYSSLLFLLETPRYITRRFLIDGAIPSFLMIVCGIAGVMFPLIQPAAQVAFGAIFGLKCVYMFYVCMREWRICKTELDNYYDQTPDIRWIKALMFISLFMSAATVVSFYVTEIHLIYYLSIPVIYTFIVFKIINFAPKKIDAIRSQNISLDAPKEEKKKLSHNLEEKLGPLVNAWMSEKKFCTPDLNIKDVAKEIGTNQNYMSQYVNRRFGVSFSLWLNTLRIEESKRLLTDGQQRSIEEIGRMTGYPQTYNFSRWFRTVTGTTPFRYRKGL